MPVTSSMKTLPVVVFCVLSLPLPGFAQGRIAFNNIFTDPRTPGTSPVRINLAPGTFNPADGPAGAYVGSDYSTSLFYVSGTLTNPVQFAARNPVWLADATFFGTTGTGGSHGYDGDGSGFFDRGVAQLPIRVFEVTFQVRAWYNGGGSYTSYAQSLASGHNVGESNLLPLFLTAPPGPVDNLYGLQPFTVGIPEPSTFVLVFFAGSLLLLFRRRK